MGKCYVIKVDYFVYDETKEDGIGREPCYLYITPDKFKLRVFEPTLNAENLYLKKFRTREEAEAYIDRGMTNSMCFDNARVEEIKL